MDGRMFHYCEKDDHLLGFVSLKEDGTVCRNALVQVPGLTAGFMSMRWAGQFSSELVKIDYSLVQVNLSSSFMQFGFTSLKSDCAELSKLMKKIKQLYKFERVAMLGHSTGAQDALYFARHGEAAALASLDAIILQGAVSDRDYLAMQDETPRMLEEAKKLREEGKEQAVLTERLCGVPITAHRFLSLAERLNDDDMFSVDLTEDELEPILSPVKAPILVCFGEHDEIVFDKLAQKAFAMRMMKVLKESSSRAECRYLPGDHGFTKAEYYEPFINCVCKFLSSLINS